MHFKQIVGCLCALSLVGCVNKQKNVDHHVDVITSIKINGSNTALNGTYTLNYNKKGLVTSINSDAINLKKADYTYDGTKITQCAMQLEKSVHTHLYTYDDHDNIIKDDTKELPSINRTYKYKYNNKKQIVRKDAKRGSAETVTTYTYNSHGRVSHFDMRKVVKGKEEKYDERDYLYDANGHFNRLTRQLYSTTLSSKTQTVRSKNTYADGNLAAMQYGSYSFTFTYITIVPSNEKACKTQQDLILTDCALNHRSPVNLLDITWLISNNQ